MDSFAITEGLVPQPDNQDDRAPQTGTGALPEGANKFQRAIAAWRGTESPTSLVSLVYSHADGLAF
jgi:homeobox protein cut-like